MKASTVNRICTALKAALNLAASHDDRITNAKAWTVGLAALPEADDTECNLVLTDQQRRDVIASAYEISRAFGLYVEVHAATGARIGQIALLNVGDLQAGAKPLLMVPSSLKGKNRRTRTRKPMPISHRLAMWLKAVAAGRAADQPLLPSPDGERWNACAPAACSPLRHRPPACRLARRSIACATPRSRGAAGRRAGAAGRVELRYQRRDDREDLLEVHRRSRRRA